MRCAIHKQSNAIGGGFAGECDCMKSSKGSRIREEIAHPLKTASLRIEHGKGGRRGRPKIKIEPALIIIATGCIEREQRGKVANIRPRRSDNKNRGVCERSMKTRSGQ